MFTSLHLSGTHALKILLNTVRRAEGIATIL